MRKLEQHLSAQGDGQEWHDHQRGSELPCRERARVEAGKAASGSEVRLELLAEEGQRIVERSYGEQAHLE